ncbi:glycoside hydrolase endolysin [Bacteriophage Phobos]|uniref:Glycoside hydrolase endolysin n=1 Tax=Bacteriophage Phobos TaxID=2662138 RepID=A0A5Q2U6W1_9CAUD|nr:glycoside hydrolase endolysin [Bacteriophage Phobos]QGH44985.1 glycoside hydrolase endolysin [Bacteriophage Phobos]WPK42381.1 glycoside hydrolase endolysin [Pseudomonas phage Ppu-503]
MKTTLTPAALRRIFPRMTENRATEVLILLDTALEAFPALDTPLRLSAFLAQAGVESGGFTKVRESLNYSIQGLLNGYPRSRISEADCRRLGRKDTEGPLSQERQREIANLVYGGRYGNNLPDDGWTYRGGGPLQLTFRDNYRAAGVALGMPLDANPAMIEDPVVGMLAAMWYFTARVDLKDVDAQRIDAVSRKVNGGDNGLLERRALYRTITETRWSM